MPSETGPLLMRVLLPAKTPQDAYPESTDRSCDGAGCRAAGAFGGCAGVRRAVPVAGRSEEPSLSAARGR